MRKILPLLFVLLILPLVSAQTVKEFNFVSSNVNGTDTYIHETNPTTNYGSNVFVRTGVDTNPQYGLFNINFICDSFSSNVQINNVTLEFWQHAAASSDPQNKEFYPMNTSWSEGSVTWNSINGCPSGTCYDNTNPLVTSRSSFGTGSFINYTLDGSYFTNVCIGTETNWDEGIIFRGGDANDIFDSSDSATTSERWKIWVNWQEEATFVVTAVTSISGSTINDFTVTVYNSTYSNTTTTNTGSINFKNLGGLMDINITAQNHIGTNISVNTSALSAYEFSLNRLNSVNLSIYDEFLGKGSSIFSNKTVNLDFVSDTFSSNYSTSNGTFYVDLLSPQDYRLTYSSAGFKQRDYYFTLENRSANNIDLYSLSDGNSTDVTFTVKDASGTRLEDATISLKRYYTSTNSYVTVAMAKTDFQGQAVINVEFDNPFYQILSQRNGFSTQTDGSRIFSTAIDVVLVTTEDSFTELDAQEGIATSLTFNNATNTFSYTFSDTAGTTREATLEVVTPTGSGDLSICTNTDTSSGSTILCVIGANDINKTLIARGKVNTLNGEGVYLTDILEAGFSLKEEFKNKIGDSGLFLTILFAGTAAGLGIISPSISILLFLVGLAAMVFIGFSAITTVIYFIIMILGIGVMWRLRN